MLLTMAAYTAILPHYIALLCIIPSMLCQGLELGRETVIDHIIAQKVGQVSTTSKPNQEPKPPADSLVVG